MDDLCALLNRVDHPNVRAIYKTFHANIEETDPIGCNLRLTIESFGRGLPAACAAAAMRCRRQRIRSLRRRSRVPQRRLTRRCQRNAM